MDETAMDPVLKKLEQLINFKDNLIVNERYQIQSLYNQLRFLGAILRNVEEKHHENSEAENLAIKISGVAYETGEIIHPAVANFLRLRESNKDKKIGFCLNLSDIMQQIRPIEVEVMQFYDKMYEIQVLEARKSSDGDCLSRRNRTMVEEEIMVGFDEEALTIKKRLAGGKKQLDVIPIVGMPGLGTKWKEISILGMLLPNLELLKLESEACWGPQWATTDGGFPLLKFLKLKYLNVERWITCSSHFPSLHLLLLESCDNLEEIPSSLGDILTLQMIMVAFCRVPLLWNLPGKLKKSKRAMETIGWKC